MKNIQLLFFILLILIFEPILSLLCINSIFDSIFINIPRSFKVQPSKEICYKYKLTNTKNKISLKFSLAKSYTSEVVIYKSLYEISMRNGEYVNYREKYLIVENAFKEIDVKNYYDYVYIIIRETKNYFFNDNIVLYDSELPITLEENKPIEMTNFMSNNEYIFTFTSNKNLQFAYSSNIPSQKLVTLEYDKDIIIDKKLDKEDIIINSKNNNLSKKSLKIIVQNIEEKSEGQEFSVIVYEKEEDKIKKIDENNTIDIFYIQNDLTQSFYFYADVSKYTKSSSINFKLDYMVKNIRYINIVSDIIYSDKSLNKVELKEYIPEKNKLIYNYDMNSDEYLRFYFYYNEQKYKYKYIIFKIEIKNYSTYFSPKYFSISLSKEIEEINLENIPFYITKSIIQNTKPYIPKYFKLFLDPESKYIFTAPFQDYINLIKGDLILNSQININYLNDQKDIIILENLSELTIQIFGNELKNAIFYIEKINPSDVIIVEEERDNNELEIYMNEEECKLNKKKYILGTYNKDLYIDGVKKVIKYWTADNGEFNLYYKNEISIDEQSLFPSSNKYKKSTLTSFSLNNHIDLFTITCSKPGILYLKPIMKTFAEKTHIMGQNSRSIFTLNSNLEILQLTSPIRSPANFLYLSILSLNGNNIKITPDTPGVFDPIEINGNKLFTQKIDIDKYKSDELAFKISANTSNALIDIEVIEVIHYNFSEYININNNKKNELSKNNFVKFIDKNVKKLEIEIEGLNNVPVTYGIIKLATNDINFIPMAFKYRTDVIKRNISLNDIIEIDNKYYGEEDIYKKYQAFIFSIHSSKLNYKYNIKIEEIGDKKINGWKVTIILIFSILILFLFVLTLIIIKKKRGINIESIKDKQPLYPNKKYILNDILESNE